MKRKKERLGVSKSMENIMISVKPNRLTQLASMNEVIALKQENELTAAKALGTTQAMTSHAGNAAVLFGFDAGRASIISDLHSLSQAHEEIAQLEPSYTGNEF
jgi:hypothetical protein